MNTKQAVTVLKKARKLLSDPKKWTMGAYARTKKGSSCEPRSRSAACFCAVGAIQHYEKDFFVSSDIEGVLDRAARETFDIAPYEGIVFVNDRLPRGRLKVLKAFDAAIAELEATL